MIESIFDVLLIKAKYTIRLTSEIYPRGTLKSRDLTSRDHQNCGDWNRETGQRVTK